MEKKIKEAYMKIKMDETSRDRILDNIAGSGEDRYKGRFRRGRLVKAAVLAACVCLSSGTVYAAYQWLNAGEVASMMGESVLAEKFNKTDTEIQVKEDNLYRATYLGEVSGKALSEMDIETDQDKTYLVMAIERTDEQEITYDESCDLIVSPFVKGIAPWRFNIYYLGGGAQSYISDNILYRIIDCPNVEIFADKGVYVGVVDGAPSSSSYQFDEESGEISSKPDYSGTNLLFELDLDKSKADSQQAEKLLKQIEDDANAEDGDEEDRQTGGRGQLQGK